MASNKKVVNQSIIALICLALMFFVSWWFVIPAVILMLLNQRELLAKKPHKTESDKGILRKKLEILKKKGISPEVKRDNTSAGWI